jgi:hypothetical protein
MFRRFKTSKYSLKHLFFGYLNSIDFEFQLDEERHGAMRLKESALALAYIQLLSLPNTAPDAQKLLQW